MINRSSSPQLNFPSNQFATNHNAQGNVPSGNSAVSISLPRSMLGQYAPGLVIPNMNIVSNLPPYNSNGQATPASSPLRTPDPSPPTGVGTYNSSFLGSLYASNPQILGCPGVPTPSISFISPWPYTSSNPILINTPSQDPRNVSDNVFSSANPSSRYYAGRFSSQTLSSSLSRRHDVCHPSTINELSQGQDDGNDASLTQSYPLPPRVKSGRKREEISPSQVIDLTSLDNSSEELDTKQIEKAEPEPKKHRWNKYNPNNVIELLTEFLIKSEKDQLPSTELYIDDRSLIINLTGRSPDKRFLERIRERFNILRGAYLTENKKLLPLKYGAVPKVGLAILGFPPEFTLTQMCFVLYKFLSLKFSTSADLTHKVLKDFEDETPLFFGQPSALASYKPLPFTESQTAQTGILQQSSSQQAGVTTLSYKVLKSFGTSSQQVEETQPMSKPNEKVTFLEDEFLRLLYRYLYGSKEQKPGAKELYVKDNCLMVKPKNYKTTINIPKRMQNKLQLFRDAFEKRGKEFLSLEYKEIRGKGFTISGFPPGFTLEKMCTVLYHCFSFDLRKKNREDKLNEFERNNPSLFVTPNMNMTSRPLNSSIVSTSPAFQMSECSRQTISSSSPASSTVLLNSAPVMVPCSTQSVDDLLVSSLENSSPPASIDLSPTSLKNLGNILQDEDISKLVEYLPKELNPPTNTATPSSFFAGTNPTLFGQGSSISQDASQPNHKRSRSGSISAPSQTFQADKDTTSTQTRPGA